MKQKAVIDQIREYFDSHSNVTAIEIAKNLGIDRQVASCTLSNLCKKHGEIYVVSTSSRGLRVYAAVDLDTPIVTESTSSRLVVFPNGWKPQPALSGAVPAFGQSSLNYIGG